jgi:hypothetical protein
MSRRLLFAVSAFALLLTGCGDRSPDSPFAPAAPQMSDGYGVGANSVSDSTATTTSTEPSDSTSRGNGYGTGSN